MGYNKENFKRIRAEYGTKTFRAQEEADARRAELYLAIPRLREMDQRLSSFGLRIMQTALKGGDTQAAIADLRAENEKLCAERAKLLRANGYPPNYTDPQYECDKCRDTGYVGIKMCDCMRRSLIEAGMNSSGLSSLLGKQTFDNFSLEYYRHNEAEYGRMCTSLKRVRDFAYGFKLAEGEPTPESFFFFGGTGLGKTHLSTAVAQVVIERGYDVFYNSAIGMVSDFEFKRFGNSVAQSEIDDTSRYTECDLLIIDDLGTEVVNQFTLSCVYHVINTRLNMGKPTIISSNLTAEEVRKLYTPRITSRLTGEYVLVPFYGNDIRKQKLQG